MKYRKLYVFAILILSLSCSKNDDSNDGNNPKPFYKGMDLSFQSELEDYNIDYKDANGNSIELLDFVKSKGTNLVRLKLWHTPQDGQNSLNDVKTYAQKIKAKGMSFLLNFHYSDYWADPSTQTPPAAWQNMTSEQIKIAIYNYTKDVVQQLKAQNTLPDIIQIGNETDSGFLWNHGRVWDNFNNNWNNYTDLVSEAIRAVRDVDTDNNIRVMLHHSNVENAIFFFNELQPYNIDFDIIGLSYYPQFHTKNLSLFTSKLNELANTFNKDILMVEVAYPFTLQWNDNQTNLIGSLDQTLVEFSPTPQGQRAYLEWLTETVQNIPNNHGIGFCYWAPDWVAFNGNSATSTNGSSWENQCLFDFELKALPAIETFNNN
ncbi:glycosyl hydrolase 53 family protein [Winogradskyella sp.]|jgi:arabinogalactan endo-1,4-beta-galactosidase|uniref:glycoside hydrolase family 53 protein n=1 Tax=Winogradskyella sp. TaxID=1883156 RepID=UPI0025E800F0|nr:glycosyl hydrolase 53 family protein [Winogradskyella sp.]MCT4630256.1 arabinogalactan endo-1,4-beta-galactosidase [Winogradskyella sp.]